MKSSFISLFPILYTTLLRIATQLVEEDRLMRRDLEDLWSRLKALWDRLETPEIDREAFELNKVGHGKLVMAAIKEEIQVCEQLKYENIGKFIHGIRSELQTWWDKCFYSAEQRSVFKCCSEGMLNYSHFNIILLIIINLKLYQR